MELWAAIYNETDGYTYSAEVVLGIFESRTLADEAVLNDFENDKLGYRKLEEYEVRSFWTNNLW